eukprot:5014625-Prymnesium_polylepis.1
MWESTSRRRRRVFAPVNLGSSRAYFAGAMPHSGALPPSRSGGNQRKDPASGGIPSVSHHNIRKAVPFNLKDRMKSWR